MYEKFLEKAEIEAVVEFLISLEPFKEFSSNDLREIALLFSTVFIDGGEILIKQGDLDPTLYILQRGRLRVFVSGNDVAEIAVGEIVGEIAILTNEPRTATVRAIRDSIVLKLSHEAFLKFETAHPESVLGIAKKALKRLVSKPKVIQPSEKIRTIVIAPAGTSAYLPFVDRLGHALNEKKPTVIVSQETCNTHFQATVSQSKMGDPYHEKINAWLERLENQFGYVLFVTDQELTPWTQRCIRHADRVFLIVQEGVLPELNSIETYLFSEEYEFALSSINMAFIHPEKKAEGTNLWLKARPTNNFYHLRLDSEEDIARIIRFLRGEAFGVVLDGGGGRGFAHAGVLKALDEAKIPIDFIGGTSSGAIVSSLYLILGSEKTIDIITKKTLVPAAKDYTFPMVSLLKGKNSSDLCRHFCQDKLIEDQWIRYFCVSTNVTKRKMKVHKTGLMWLAVRESSSIPGVYPPLYDEEGSMLVDGAVINNLPVDVMRKLLGGGKILAVSCYSQLPLVSKINRGNSWISGWKLLLQRLKLWKKSDETPHGIFEVLRISFTLAADEHQKKMEKEADYLIALDTKKFRALDFTGSAEIINIGYRAAKEKIKEIFNI